MRRRTECRPENEVSRTPVADGGKQTKACAQHQQYRFRATPCLWSGNTSYCRSMASNSTSMAPLGTRARP